MGNPNSEEPGNFMMAVWDTTLIKDTIRQTAIGRIGRISFFFFF